MGTPAPSEQPKSKQDPFAFVSNQPTPAVDQNQPKKFDPFALSGPTSNPAPVNTTTSKPSGGLPGSFKKFHANTNTSTNPTPIQVQTQPVTQPSHSTDLLGALNDLHFEASPSQSPTLINNQQNIPQNNLQNGHNKGGFSGQTQGFGNQPGPSGGYNVGNQWNQPQGFTGGMNMNVNMNMGMYGNNNQFYGQQRGYPNQNYPPQGNFGYGYGGNYGGMSGFNAGYGQGNSMNMNMNMMDPSKKFDEMENLLKQDWTFASEDDKKKKQKSENEKAFDALKF